jgi:hypothetical protein
MSLDVSDLRPTIVPKSDQLNADQLVAGPMTVTVSEVRVSSSDDQPVVVHYQGENGRPFKPCKTMRKVMVFAWGEDGRKWVGRSMTLYNDPAVKFGGADVGGIRISHMTDIDRDVQVSLTATKGKKALHVIKVLRVTSLGDVLAAIKAASNRETMNKAKALAKQLTNQADIDEALKAYARRVDELSGKAATTQPAAFDLATKVRQIEDCPDIEALQVLCDEAEVMPEGDDKAAVLEALTKRDNELAAQ